MASIPLSEIETPNESAFFIPGESKFLPANKEQRIKLERTDLINKSVPIFPDPMIAIFNLFDGNSCS
jgi:hypothetical protein